MNYLNITIKLSMDKDICKSFRKLKLMYEVPHLFRAFSSIFPIIP